MHVAYQSYAQGRRYLVGRDRILRYADVMREKTAPYHANKRKRQRGDPRYVYFCPLSGNLSGGNQQKVMIGRWLATNPSVLILDEPTSSLDENEVELLFKLMRDLKSHGVGIIFITHFLEQVYEVCDKITVLRNGELVGEYTIADLPRVKLISAMLGKDMEDMTNLKNQKRPYTGAGEVVYEAI